MRLFFALLPEPGLARDIDVWRQRNLSTDGRPVPMANLHITLAFLGDLSPHRLEGLCQAAEELLASPGTSLDPLTLDEVGYWSSPGILWLGPAYWTQALENLAARLQARGVQAGGRGTRTAYRPHLTLFRGCDQPPLPPLSPPGFTFDCTHLALLESRQGRQGVQYADVANWQLSP